MSTVGDLARIGRRLTRTPRRPARPGTLARRRLRVGPVLVVIATGVVGFLLVSQLRTTERFTQRLEQESEEDLARILASLTGEADALRDEISDLKLQLADLRATNREDDSAGRAAEQQLQALSVLAGTVPVTGPGLTLRIEDPEGSVGYDTLIDAVQELRDAGAEALAVNDRRIGVASAFSERDGRVLLDGAPLSTPFRIVAIGQPATLDGGLKIPGGVLDTLEALPGVRSEVSRSARLDLPALARPPAFRVARPVGSAP